MADIATYSRPTRSILLATASASRPAVPSLRPHRWRSMAAALGFGIMEKVLPKRLGFEAPVEQPRMPSGGAPSVGHVGRRQAAQAGSTVSYDVLGLSNARE